MIQCNSQKFSATGCFSHSQIIKITRTWSRALQTNAGFQFIEIEGMSPFWKVPPVIGFQKDFSFGLSFALKT